MPHTVRVSDEFYDFICSNGKMGDTAESVLRRLTGWEPQPSTTTTGKRAKSGDVTPATFYEPYILKSLYAAPDHARRTADVLKDIAAKVKPHLKPADLKPLKSGMVRWENKTEWARSTLVDQGLIEKPNVAGHGVWKLTSKGVTAASRL